MQGPGLNHWQNYGPRWTRVREPLRPDAQVVDRMRALVAGHPGRALLLGVTPELAALFDTLDAVDKNVEVIATQWPGDSPGRRAIVGDWLEFGSGPDAYAVVAGDGSLNMATSPAMLSALLLRTHQLLAPGGLFFCRLFERPERAFSEDDLRAALGGRLRVNFHAFKWMMAMHLADTRGMVVAVAEILELFERLSPDRAALARRTGWPMPEIDTIEVYRGSQIRYVFPARAEWIAALPAGVRADFLPAGDYDLAACCPILSYRKA